MKNSRFPTACRDRGKNVRLGIFRRAPDEVGRLMAEPGMLALGVTAGIAFPASDRLVQVDLTAQRSDQPRHPMSPHRRQSRVELPRREPTNLFECVLLHHPVEARIDPGPKDVPVRRQKAAHGPRRIEHGTRSRPLKFGEGTPGRLEHFERPQNALRIGRPEPRRGHGIAGGEFRMQILRRTAFRRRADPGADLVGHARHLGQTREQRPEVKPGPARHDRHPALGAQSRDRCARIFEPLRDGVETRGVDMPEEQMRHRPLLLRRRTRGDDAEIGIDLHGVGIDHRAAEAFGQPDRERGLAARRRSCDEDGLDPADHVLRLPKAAMTSYVATLVSNPAAPALTDALIARAAQAAGALRTETLDAGIAADLFFEAADAGDGRTLADAVRAALDGAPVDVIAQPAAGRRKHLFLADMDSTMIGQECIDELADFVGLKERVSAITERAMRGELAFEPALRERVGLLAGLDVSVIATIIADRITLTPGGRELVMTMRANGAYTALVSGGFTLFTGPVSKALGFEEHRSNILLTEDGKLAGRVQEPILGKEAKLASLVELRDARGLAKSATMAVGDGANDLAMLDEAGLGLAFRAKPAVAAAAHARIDHADLTALLYAQGYRAADFVR
jgi:phosphoserine phosphatase